MTKNVDFDNESYWTLSSDWNSFFIYGDIDESFSEKIVIPFIKEMKIQKHIKFGEMKIYINSGWWLLYQAMELLSLIEQCKNNLIIVKTFVNSRAASAASIIAVAWQERFVWKNARHLIHHARWWSYQSSPKQLDNNDKNWKEMFKFVTEHYKQYTKIKDIESKLNEDNHYIRWWKNLIKQWLADNIIEDSLII